MNQYGAKAYHKTSVATASKGKGSLMQGMHPQPLRKKLSCGGDKTGPRKNSSGKPRYRK
jgi:hypothetical protein